METGRDRLESVLLALIEWLREDGAGAAADRSRLLECLAAQDVDESDLGALLERVTTGWWSGQPTPWLEAPEADVPSPGAVRMLAEIERNALSTEAQGYLVSLRQGEQISWRQFECLLYLASLATDGRLQRSDVERLLDQIVVADHRRGGLYRESERRSH
jgi:hypothetical protein